jgi:multidrug efflux system membrane fusion protein
MHRLLLTLALSAALLAVTAGCRHRPTQPAPPEPPRVPVSQPVQRLVTDYADYPGQTEAVESVDITPRASGYLIRMPFKEGTEVDKGALLFEIDPRPYQAAFDVVQAQVRQAEANVELAKAEYARGRRAGSSITAEDLDKLRATQLTSAASLRAAQANLETARLNLSFTKVTSPIKGIVSRYRKTVGNLVIQDQTVLTTVVSFDPIHVYFNMDSRTLLRIRALINQGKIKVPSDRSEIPIYLGLETEEGYPHRGNFNFINNQVNPGTATISVRGVFANPKPENGVRLLSPGLFVRIRLPIGQAHEALLVVDRAIGSDQGRKFLYVVDADNRIQYRRIRTGPLQDDGLRVIDEGVKPDDRVVVGALPQIRPRMQVEVEPVTMPTLGGPSTPDSSKPQPPPPGEKK